MGARLATAPRLKYIGSRTVGASAAAAGVAVVGSHVWPHEGTSSSPSLAAAQWISKMMSASSMDDPHIPMLRYARTDRNNRLVAAVAALHESHPPPPIWGHSSHLQMMVHNWKKKQGASSIVLKRDLLRHDDGGVTALDWVETCGDNIIPRSGPMAYRTAECEGRRGKAEDVGGGMNTSVSSTESSDNAPVVVLLHTITGKDDDAYGLGTLIRAIHRRGWRVVVHARRGCGGLPLTTPKFNILGDPRDTTDAIDAVRAAVGPNAPIFAVGLSAGSAALIRYLGETGENTPVMAAVAISPGHRLPDAWERCHRVYNRILTDKVRRHFLEPNADVLTRLPDGRAALEAGMKASAIREFVERTCVFSGAVTHDDYTRETDPCRVVGRVAVPTLAISALDDPVCSTDGVDLGLFDNNPNLVLAATKKGSHLAFYQGAKAVPWVDDAVVQWLDAALIHAAHIENPTESRSA